MTAASVLQRTDWCLGEVRGASQQVPKTDHFHLQKKATAKMDGKEGGTPVLGRCVAGSPPRAC